MEQQQASTVEISRSVAASADAAKQVSAKICNVSRDANSVDGRANDVRDAISQVSTHLTSLRAILVKVVRTSTEEELDVKLTEAKIELFNLRFQAATGQLESHGRLRAVRKEIARIYTVKRERELGIVVIEDEETDDE